MLRIPFYKPSIGAEEIDEVVKTLKGGWLTTGPRTKQFEKEFAAYLHQKHAVAVNSCTAALHLALEAIGLKAGHAVIVPTMTFAATAEVVRYLGGRPILVDCRVEDFNLDVADAERKIQSALAHGQSIAAIMPVHYGGQIGDVAGVQTLAQRYNLKVVEDAAHCCPAYYKDYRTTGLRDYGTTDGESRKQKVESRNGPRTTDQQSEVRSHRSEANGRSTEVSSPVISGQWSPVGSSADISCYSFYANKTITTGEGGMACTENDEYADRMRIMSLHGISRDAWKRYTAEGSWYYEIIAPGYKYNLTDIAAAIGLHQLRKADLFHRRRTAIVARYFELLRGVEELIMPEAHPDRIHSWHLFVIRLRLEKLRIDRAQFIADLQKAGIGTSVHWLPLHMHPYYRETYGYNPQDLPVAAGLYPQIVTLPVYPDMSEAQVKHVCDSIKGIVSRNWRRAKSGTLKVESARSLTRRY
jgi:dTDP-4-amino-4,6-dideoxygalactose transaminase